MRNKIIHIIWVMIIFVYIYGPPLRVSPINISTVVFLPLAALYFIQNQPGINETRRLFKAKGVLVVSILLYVLVTIVDGDHMLGLAFFVLLLVNIPTAWMLVMLIQERGYLWNKSIVLDVAFASATISIVLYMFPEANNWVKFELLKYDEELMRFQLFRGFGFSDELLYTFSIAQAIAFYLCLMSGLNIVRKVVYSLSILISITFNAKIGILLCAIAIIIYLLNVNIRMRAKIPLMMLLMAIAYISVLRLDEDALFLTQMNLFIDEITAVNKGTLDQTSIGVLTSKMIFLPESSYELFFGSGLNVFGTADGRESDSGWIILIHFGGIVLMALTTLVVALLIKGLIRKKYVALGVFLALVFLIANTKGLFFSPKPGMRMFILVYFLAIYGMLDHGMTARQRVPSQ